jgi:hypothetical protein
MFDRKKVKLFFTFLFRVVKTAPPRAGAPTPPPALVIKRLFMARKKKPGEKTKNKIIGHEVLFHETTFSASALEH